MAEVTPFGTPRLLGTISKGKRFKCGGWTGCDEDHEFFMPEQVLVLSDAEDITDLREDHEHWDEEKMRRAVERGTLYESKGFIVPTLLGEWWDDCSSN